MAGCSSAKLTTAKPAVRVDAAWKRPPRKRKPPGRPSTTGALSCGCEQGFHAQIKGQLTSRTIKKIRSMPFSSTRTQKSHQLAPLGNKSVKQRRGWSRRNLNSSHTPLRYGTHFEQSQITKRSMQGKPVFPMMIRKVPRRSGRTASWKRTMESGLRVNPRSLNSEAGVKNPLVALAARSHRFQTLDIPPDRIYTDCTEFVGVICIIHNPRKQADHAQEMKADEVRNQDYS